MAAFISIGYAFLRRAAVRQGLRFLRIELPGILAKRTDVLSPRMLHLIEGLADDWHRLDERIEVLSSEIGEDEAPLPPPDRPSTPHFSIGNKVTRVSPSYPPMRVTP